MTNAFGIIYTGEGSPAMGELTRSRSTTALPVGGRYRIVDLLLSNLVNAGIGNVGVMCQRNYHSLMDHLGNGREWDLSRKRDGLFILPPYVSSESRGEYNGMLDALHSNINYLRRSAQKYVIVIGSPTLYNIDFTKVLDYHIEKNADVTVLCKRNPGAAQAQDNKVCIDLDDDGRVIDIEIHPLMPHYSTTLINTFIIEKTLLLYIIDSALSHGRTDILRDVFQRNLGDYRIYAYAHNGYAKDIETTNDFFEANMDMLNGSIRREIFMGERSVRTKTKDEVPAKYLANARAKNSLLADGCVIAGVIEDSVLFRGVNVGANTRISNSIVMQGCYIGEGCELENVILDKNVYIKPGQHLAGTANYPVVVRKNMVI